MRKIITYFVLFAFSMVLLKPVLPIMVNAMAHAFWYAKHTATVHYENGKYHLHKEIASIASKDQSQQNNNTIKQNLSQDLYVSHIENNCNNCFSTIRVNYQNKSCYLINTYPFLLYPPPKV